MHPFENVDHPLIITAQAVCAVGLFRYFFYIHRQANAVPATSAGLAFLLLTNLYARVTHAEWFWVIDAAQYAGLAVQIGVVCLSKEEEKKATPSPPKPDLFDNIRQRFLWTVGLIALALVVYASVKAYNENKAAKLDTVIAVTKENTAVTAHYDQAQAAYDHKRDSILAKVTSISDSQATILSSLKSVSVTVVKAATELKTGQQKLSHQAERKAAAVQQVAAGVDTTRVNTETIKTQLQNESEPSKPTDEKPKKGPFWKRWFSGKTSRAAVPADSTGLAGRADSLRPDRTRLLPAGTQLSGFRQPLSTAVSGSEKEY